MPNNEQTPSGLTHGATQLPSVVLGSYNVELRDQDGFIGDRASFRAFRTMLEEWREKLRQVGDDDPLGAEASTDISKKKLDKLLLEGDPKAAGVVHATIEEFADELASVVRRFVRLKGWKDTERIAVGGGLRASHKRAPQRLGRKRRLERRGRILELDRPGGRNLLGPRADPSPSRPGRAGRRGPFGAELDVQGP